MPSGPRPDLHKSRQRICACTVLYRKSWECLKTRRLPGHRRDGNVIQLLDKRGFLNNQVPVLVVRQKPVKSRSGGGLERSGDGKPTVVQR